MLTGEGHVKIIDFGLATFAEPDQTINGFCGVMNYCAPEVCLSICNNRVYKVMFLVF